jgi:AcrR family transcriptional regulator
MKMSHSPQSTSQRAVAKRPYRMSARAGAAAATRERLLTVAWAEFSTRPYEEVRLTEIAEQAEVTVQTLHLRFGSKERLFTAAYSSWGLPVIAAREEAPVGDVVGAVANLFDRYEAHGEAVLRLLSQEERIPAVAEMTEAGRLYHRAWAEKTFARLLDGLRGKALRRRSAAIVLATDVLAWKVLRHDVGLTRAEAELAMIEIVDPSRAEAGGRR